MLSEQKSLHIVTSLPSVTIQNFLCVHRLKEVTLDYAEPRNTGLARAYAVEMCGCPEGYNGLSCEDCAIGYTRSFTGIYLGTCVPCECSGRSKECDPETGECSVSIKREKLNVTTEIDRYSEDILKIVQDVILLRIS